MSTRREAPLRCTRMLRLFYRVAKSVLYVIAYCRVAHGRLTESAGISLMR